MSDVPDSLSLHKLGDLSILARCLSCLRPYWRLTAAALLALLGSSGLALLTPQFIRRIVDQGIGRQDVHLLRLTIPALLGLTLVKGGLAFLQGQCAETASQNVAYDLRNAIHRKLSELSFSYHDRAEAGQILSRAVQDVDRVRFVTGRAFVRLAEGLVMLLGTAAVLLWMNPRLALVAMATMPLLGYRAFRFGRRLRPLSLAIQQQLGVLTTRLEQSLRGARVVKAFAQEENEITRFGRQNARWFDLSASSARLQAFNTPLMDLIANAGVVLIVWYGGFLVIRSRLTLGELVAFTTYLAQLVQPVRRLGNIIPALAQATSAGERVFEILDTQSEVQEMPEAVTLPPVRGDVCFEHVSFAYFRRRRALSDVTFQALPGAVIALLGATGSGKSTIINLIPRFYDATCQTGTGPVCPRELNPIVPVGVLVGGHSVFERLCQRRGWTGHGGGQDTGRGMTRRCKMLAATWLALMLVAGCASSRPATRVSPTATPKPTLQVPTPAMVLVEAGSFQMGSRAGRPEEQPVHTVRITQALYIARYAVTFEDYDLFCEDSGQKRPDDAGRGRGMLPVINVTWYGAVAYCNWLSEKEGLTQCYSGSGSVTQCDLTANGYRLPTEAEWEYAARGGQDSRGYTYPGSDDPDQVAWYAANSGGLLHRVGQKQPNELGLYDMSGNLFEWCWDWYGEDYYASSPTDDPQGPRTPEVTTVRGGERVRRGGSWREEADSIRTTARSADYASYVGDNGFRLVRLK